MQKEKPFTGMLEDPSFKEHVADLRSCEKSPEARLESLNKALGIISTQYKKGNDAGYIEALKGYSDIFWGNQPLILDYLRKKRLPESAPISAEEKTKEITEKTIVYTLSQAANDAACICLQNIISSPKLPEGKKDDVTDFALRFIEKQIGMGSELGDESIVLRALNNSTKLNTDKALRHFHDKNASREAKTKARGIIEAQIEKTINLVSWAGLVITMNEMNTNPDKIKFVSAIQDEKLEPATTNQVSLKYIANSLNTLGALYTLKGYMTLYPNEPTTFFADARKVLTVADKFHMKYLEGKLEGKGKRKEFEQRKLAIQSNLGYTYIIQMYKGENFDHVTVNDLHENMANIENNFIKNFLLPLGFLEKDTRLTPVETNKIKDFFRMESITRSLEILGLMDMSNTNRSTTLNMDYLATEKRIYNAILAHFNINESSEESIKGDASLIVKRANIQKAALRLVGMGILFLEESKTPADNEDRIFFNEALERVKELLEAKTEPVTAQI